MSWRQVGGKDLPGPGSTVLGEVCPPTLRECSWFNLEATWQAQHINSMPPDPWVSGGFVFSRSPDFVLFAFWGPGRPAGPVPSSFLLVAVTH